VNGHSALCGGLSIGSDIWAPFGHLTLLFLDDKPFVKLDQFAATMQQENSNNVLLSEELGGAELSAKRVRCWRPDGKPKIVLAVQAFCVVCQP
jgi:hypothetical protein